MTSLFLAQTPASATFAETLRQELHSKGYTLSAYPTANTTTAASQIERAIIGSAVVLIPWEHSAATTTWERLHLETARRFQKPLVLLLLDATPVPPDLSSFPTLSGSLPSGPTVAALVALNGFPSARSTDPLLTLYEDATSSLTRQRRAAIEQAAALLAQNQHRDALLLLLTYLAKHDQTTSLQKEAGKVLLEDGKQHMPAFPLSTVEASLMIRGMCSQNHISYYNRRVLCRDQRVIAYEALRAPVQRDEIHVPCKHPDCSLNVVLHIDCTGY